MTLHSKARFEQNVIYPKGCNQNPLTETEQRDKFIDCGSPVLGTKGAAELHALLTEFGRLKQISDITRRLRPARKEEM